MTLHRNRFLVHKTNRCTEFQFYWYYNSTCFGQPFCPSSGVLSRISALVHFVQLWPFATRSRMELRSKRSQLHKVYQSRSTAKNSWRGAERLPETCRVVIPMKLEFSASVGFIDKESARGMFLGRSFSSQRPAIYAAYLASNFAMIILFYVQKQRIAVG